jgi:Flp pilus assembly protein TadD
MNMIKGPWILVPLVALLTSCGSSPKQEERSDGLDDDSIVLEAAPATKPVDAVSEKAPEVKRETPKDAYSPLADAYKSQNEEGIYRSAIAILSQNPADVKALNALGLYHYRKARFLAARYFFSRAQVQSPRSSELYNNQGLVSLALGENRDAIRAFKKALELNPNDGIAAANLGSIYVQEKDYYKAIFPLEIAVKKGMRETRTLTNYAIACVGTGKYDTANAALEEALEQNSNNKEALFALAKLQISHMKQYKEGQGHLDRLKFLSPAQEMRNRMNTLENEAKAGIQ